MQDDQHRHQAKHEQKQREARMAKWLVYRGSRRITEVYYLKDCDADYVRRSLVNHDGYPSDIEVRKA